MKSFLIGIILFVILVVGGMAALSMMDVNVPQEDVVITINPTPAIE